MAGLPPTISDGTVTLTFGSAGVYYGYCTIADTLYEFPNKNAYSTLTNSVVAQEITYAAQELQQQLDHYYQMPYVGTNGGILLTMRETNAKLACAKLIDRYFTGSEPDLSPAGKELRAWAESKVLDIVNGTERWGQEVGGDAVARPMATVYDLSQGAFIAPSPNSVDPLVANPLFSMANTRYRKTDIL